MKKLSAIFAGLFLISGSCFAGLSRQTEADFFGVQSSSDVVISTFAWTQIGSTNTLIRTGILVSEYATNTSNMLLVISTSSVAPTLLTQGNLLVKGSSPWFVSIAPAMYLWALSLNGSGGSERVYAEELK